MSAPCSAPSTPVVEARTPRRAGRARPHPRAARRRAAAVRSFRATRSSGSRASGPRWSSSRRITAPARARSPPARWSNRIAPSPWASAPAKSSTRWRRRARPPRSRRDLARRFPARCRAPAVASRARPRATGRGALSGFRSPVRSSPAWASCSATGVRSRGVNASLALANADAVAPAAGRIAVRRPVPRLWRRGDHRSWQRLDHARSPGSAPPPPASASGRGARARRRRPRAATAPRRASRSSCGAAASPWILRACFG